jgi:two-component system sensor histidine kinase BaeS
MGGRLTLITHKTLGGEHLDDVRLPSELAPFRDALSGMLGRLDEAMRQQKRFTADASHELRTPLALAKSTLQAAQIKEASTEGYRRAIAETLEDIGRMECLLDQLLTLARMDEAPDSFESEEMSLDEVLAGVAIAYSPRASEHGGKIVCDPMSDTRVHGNKVQLEQLFGNLLDNATRHGPPGGTVRIALAPDGNGWCVVTVHDDGGGISPEDLPRLFDRFCRADVSRTRATGGTGLGLSIVQEIARCHGGRVEIVSNPDEGTNVRVYLPQC